MVTPKVNSTKTVKHLVLYSPLVRTVECEREKKKRETQDRHKSRMHVQITVSSQTAFWVALHPSLVSGKSEWRKPLRERKHVGRCV